MPQPVDPESQKRQDRLMKLLHAGRSDGYQQIAKRLREARELFHEEIALQIQAPLNKWLSQLPHETLREKQNLVRMLNSELRALGLAVCFGTSAEPARLYANTGHEPEGRFQVETLNPIGGHRRRLSWVELPEFRFTAHPGRREPLAEYWAERVGTERKPRSRE